MPLLCELGFHEWKWKYLKQNSCDIQLVCTQCRKTKGAVKVRHQWNKAYASPISCEMQETCTRCGSTAGSISVVHEWQVITLNSCATEEVCKRCGAIGEITEKGHDWNKTYTKPNFCEMQETCRRCGTTRGPLNVVHEWEWCYAAPVSFIKQEVCKRCKTIGRTDDTGQRTWKEICADKNREEKFLALQQAIGNLSKSAKFWHITDESQARVRIMITRQSASVIEEFLPYTNILIYGILLGDKRLFFFPNDARLLQGKNSGSLNFGDLSANYDALTVRFSTTSFAETGSIPNDSIIADYTWKHVRVDGGPDRRHADNPRIPFLNYGEVELLSQTGWRLLLQLSNVARAQEFADALYIYIRTCTTSGYKSSGRTESNQRERTKSDTRTDLERSNPYEVLGVNPNASRNEIMAAYRKLALENHPDKVAGMALEFRELAERRMKIINVAYEEIKQNWS